MESATSNTIVFVPGLGGHRSVFNGYGTIIGGNSFKYLEIVNWPKAAADLEQIAQECGQVMIIAHCYGAQLAIRLIEKNPSAVKRLVIIEPFFSEFYPIIRSLMPVNWIILKTLEIMDYLGLRRKKFNYIPDYQKLAKYPMVFQPLFDWRWQNMTDFFKKTQDIATFNLPPRIETKTLFVVSPGGYLRSSRKREKIFNIFVNHDIIEISQNTHNIITVSGDKIARSIKKWLTNKP